MCTLPDRPHMWFRIPCILAPFANRDDGGRSFINFKRVRSEDKSALRRFFSQPKSALVLDQGEEAGDTSSHKAAHGVPLTARESCREDFADSGKTGSLQETGAPAAALALASAQSWPLEWLCGQAPSEPRVPCCLLSRRSSRPVGRNLGASPRRRRANPHKALSCPLAPGSEGPQTVTRAAPSRLRLTHSVGFWWTQTISFLSSSAHPLLPSNMPAPITLAWHLS